MAYGSACAPNATPPAAAFVRALLLGLLLIRP